MLNFFEIMFTVVGVITIVCWLVSFLANEDGTPFVCPKKSTVNDDENK